MNWESLLKISKFNVGWNPGIELDIETNDKSDIIPPFAWSSRRLFSLSTFGYFIELLIDNKSGWEFVTLII